MKLRHDLISAIYKYVHSAKLMTPKDKLKFICDEYLLILLGLRIHTGSVRFYTTTNNCTLFAMDFCFARGLEHDLDAQNYIRLYSTLRKELIPHTHFTLLSKNKNGSRITRDLTILSHHCRALQDPFGALHLPRYVT